MHELTIHLVGTGSVGLAYGYLLSERGHHVSHTSLRGVPPPRLRVSLQSARGVAQAWYTPRYRHATSQAAPAQVNIFALHGAQLLPALRRCTGALAPTACNLVFCSDPDPVGDAWRQVSSDSYTLVYPLLSAEHCGDRGLRIVTNRAVEVCAAPAMTIGERMALISLFDRMGLTVSAWVEPPHFRARHLQTAAVYIALLAVGIGILDRARVDAALLNGIHGELAAMASLRDQGGVADMPADRHCHYPLLAALIATGDGDGAAFLLADSLSYLAHEGRRKLIAHLAAIAPTWNHYLASAPAPIAIQGLISSALAICKQ